MAICVFVRFFIFNILLPFNGEIKTCDKDISENSVPGVSVFCPASGPMP